MVQRAATAVKLEMSALLIKVKPRRDDTSMMTPQEVSVSETPQKKQTTPKDKTPQPQALAEEED